MAHSTFDAQTKFQCSQKQKHNRQIKDSERCDSERLASTCDTTLPHDSNPDKKEEKKNPPETAFLPPHESRAHNSFHNRSLLFLTHVHAAGARALGLTGINWNTSSGTPLLLARLYMATTSHSAPETPSGPRRILGPLLARGPSWWGGGSGLLIPQRWLKVYKTQTHTRLVQPDKSRAGPGRGWGGGGLARRLPPSHTHTHAHVQSQ